MNTQVIDGLELIVAEPRTPLVAPPLLFIHGAFAGAWVWAERWLPCFAERGYRAAALSLRGHGNSDGHAHIDALSINDFVDDVAVAIERLGAIPVLLGHSMGGFVVQKYLERHPVPAAVLMSSVPPQGLMTSTLHVASRRPRLLLDLNRLMSGGPIAADSVREALFATDIPAAKIRDFKQRMSTESQRAIWDMTMFNLVWPYAVDRTPLMVLGTEEDRLIPPFLVEATAQSYQVPARIFRGFGHGFMLEEGSERIADAVIDWLDTLQL